MTLKQSKQQNASNLPELEYLGHVSSEGADTKNGCCGQTVKCAQLPLCIYIAERIICVD